MNKDNFIEFTMDHNICQSGLRWVLSFEGDLYQMWSQCERGDWLLWLLGTLKANKKKTILATCECINLGLQIVPDKEAEDIVYGIKLWTENEINDFELEAIENHFIELFSKSDFNYTFDSISVLLLDIIYGGSPLYRIDEVANNTSLIALDKNGLASRIDALKKCADIVRSHFTFEEVYSLLVPQVVMYDIVKKHKRI